MSADIVRHPSSGRDGADAELLRIMEIHDRVEARRHAGPVERDAWIRASRLIFSPGEQQPCWVCGKFRSVTQAHHVVPLVAQYDRGFKYPDHESLWLCPSHHSLAHRFILSDSRSMSTPAMEARDRRRAAIHDDLSDPEFEKMMGLMRMAARGPV